MIKQIKKLRQWLKHCSNIILGQILTFAGKTNTEKQKAPSKFYTGLKTQYQTLKVWIMNHPFVFLYLVVGTAYAICLGLHKRIYGEWVPKSIKYVLWRIKNSLINAGFLKDTRTEQIKNETTKLVNKKIKEKLKTKTSEVLPKQVKVNINLLNKNFDYKKWRDENKVPSPGYFADKKTKKK